MFGMRFGMGFGIGRLRVGLSVPTLSALALDATTITEGQAAIINITGATDGSTITGSMPSGLTLDSASRQITGTPDVVGGFNFDLVETLADIANSPRTTNVSLTVQAAADVTAPTISSASGAANGANGMTGMVTTDEGNGTLYWFISTSASAPSVANLKAAIGAVAAGSQAVSASGMQMIADNGMTAETAYYVHYVHTDAADNDSNVASSASFTTAAEPSASITYITTLSGNRDAELGMPDDYWTSTGEQEAAMDMDLSPYTHNSVQDGDWSDTATWDTGTVPGAGDVVNVGHDVLYDTITPIGANSVGLMREEIESDYAAAYTKYSAFALKDVMVGMMGKLRFDPTQQTMLLCDTLFAMGLVEIGNEAAPIPDSGVVLNGNRVPMATLAFIGSEDPGASMRLGMVTMGKHRVWGESKDWAVNLSAAITAGQTSFTLESAPSNWRVGDRILIPGTAFTGTQSTDSRYTGPAAYYGPDKQTYGDWPDSGSMLQRSANKFKIPTQDEWRTITNVSGSTITVDSAFTYNHDLHTGTLPDATVKTIPVPIQNFSRSIEFLGFCLDEKGSGANRRPHTMQMFSDDCVRKFARYKDLGRTRVDASLWFPGQNDDTAGLRASNGGALLADATNVIARYAIHDHWTGPYLYRRAIIDEGVCCDVTPTGGLNPGRAYVQHHSRAHIKGFMSWGARATGMFAELGSEIGQWEDCYCSGQVGDGFGYALYGDRHEVIYGHTGHMGVGFQMEARNIIPVGWWAGSSRIGFNYHQSKAEPMAQHTPDHRNLRMVDPLAMGLSNSYTYTPYGADMRGKYGHLQAQIPHMDDLTCLDCEVGFFVAARDQVDNKDVMPMLGANWLLHSRSPYSIGNYSFNYFIKDFFFKGSGTSSGDIALQFGTKTYNFNFANGRVTDYQYVVEDQDFNYLGFLVDIDTNAPNVQKHVDHTLGSGLDPTNHPQYAIMGPWGDQGDNGSNAIARIRQYTLLDSGADLPQPYPSATFAPADPAPAQPTPRYHDWGGSAIVDPVLSGGTITPTGRSQISYLGVIVDSLGVRKWPTFQRFQSNNTDPTTARTGDTIFGSEIVERNGCWDDGGTWKSTLWFMDADRITHEILYLRVDVTLSGFDAGFLADHEVADANATKPSHPLTLEDYSYSDTPTVETKVGPFSFEALSAQAVDTTVQSVAPARVDRLSMGQSVAVSIAGGEYRKNGGSWTSSAGTAMRGDEFDVRLTTGSSAGAYTATLTIGDQSADFVATAVAGGFSGTVYDDFSGTAGTDLVGAGRQSTSGHDWTTVVGADTGFEIDADGKLAQVDNGNKAAWLGGLSVSDVFVEGIFEFVSGGNSCALFARHDDTLLTGYYLLYTKGAQQWRLQRRRNGAADINLTTLNEDLASGTRVVRLEVTGSGISTTLNVYFDGVLNATLSTVDNNALALNGPGRVGVYGFKNSGVPAIRVDDFDAGAI